MNNKDAVVLINKGSGVTSFECLKYVKKNVNKKTGHCGTLDKFATGLIIALCGKYTKKTDYFMGIDKTYEATVCFGKETDTLDPEGEIIKTGSIPSLEIVKENVKKLTGKLDQIPPIYSAIHVNGNRSYLLARKGIEVELKSRPVTIYSSEILAYENGFLKIRLKVSKGTYIRSYARDLGKLCSSCAYLTQLCRTQIGPYSIDEAIPFNDQDKLSNITDDESIKLLARLEEYKN